MIDAPRLKFSQMYAIYFVLLSISNEGVFIGPPLMLRNYIPTRLLISNTLWVNFSFISVASTNAVVVSIENLLATTETSSGMVCVAIWLRMVLHILSKDTLFFQM